MVSFPRCYRRPNFSALRRQLALLLLPWVLLSFSLPFFRGVRYSPLYDAQGLATKVNGLLQRAETRFASEDLKPLRVTNEDACIIVQSVNRTRPYILALTSSLLDNSAFPVTIQREERHTAWVPQLQGVVNVTFVPVRGRSSFHREYDSYLTALQQCQPWQFLIVLEDDVVVSKDFGPKLASLLPALNESGICYGKLFYPSGWARWDYSATRLVGLFLPSLLLGLAATHLSLRALERNGRLPYLVYLVFWTAFFVALLWLLGRQSLLRWAFWLSHDVSHPALAPTDYVANTQAQVYPPKGREAIRHCLG